MYICISNKAKHLKTQIMTTTMKLAIETYSNLTGQTFNSLVEKSLAGDKVVTDNIMKLMFLAL
jgi:hypothetical protein